MVLQFFSVFQAEKPYLVRHLLRSGRVPFILRTVKTEGEKSMLNIAICDDSRDDRKRLRKFLEETGFLVSIQEFESGEALLRLEETFPVIFLDIDMKGISGIETARLLRKKDKKAKIIYVTAYDDFREYAFSVHAFAYLVKPLDGEKIRQILKEAMEYTEEEVDVLLGFETETGFRKIGKPGYSLLGIPEPESSSCNSGGRVLAAGKHRSHGKKTGALWFLHATQKLRGQFFPCEEPERLRYHDVGRQSGADFPEEIIRVPGRAGGLAVRTDLKEVQSGLVESFFACAGISDFKRLPV